MRTGAGAVVVALVLVGLGHARELGCISADFAAEIGAEVSADLGAALEQLLDL